MAGQTLKIWTLVTVLWCGTLQGTDSQAFTLNIPVETVYPELVPLYTRNSTGDNYVYTFHFSNDWATKFFNYFCDKSQRESQTVSRDRLTQSVKDIRQPFYTFRGDSDGVVYCYVGNDTLNCLRLDIEGRSMDYDIAEDPCQDTSTDLEDAESCKAIHILLDERHFDNLYKNDINVNGGRKPNVYRKQCIILEPFTLKTVDLVSTTTLKATSTTGDGRDIPGTSTVKTPTRTDSEISTWMEFITSSTILQHKTTTTTTESAEDVISSTIPTATEGMTCTHMDNLKEIWQLQQLIQGRMSLINQYVQDVSGWQLEIQNRLRLIPGLTED